MGTRAVYTFKDEYSEFHVYKHYDGYPAGAADFFTKAVEKSWGLQRFEADEFAASFVAANKEKGGDVRLTKHYDDHGDLSYRYELSQAPNGQLIVKAFEYRMSGGEQGYVTTEVDIFYGRLKDFVKENGWADTRKLWNKIDKSDNKIPENA